MVSKDPLVGSHKGSFGFDVGGCSLFEVPNASSGGNDELSAPNDESTDPKEGEDEVYKQVLCGAGPFNCRYRVVRIFSGFSYTVEVDGGDHPESYPHANDHEESQRHKEYSNGVSNEIRSCLHDSDSEFNSAATTEQNDYVDYRQHPKQNAHCLHNRFSIIRFEVLVSVEETVEPTSYEHDQNDDEGEVNDWFGHYS